MLPAIVRPPRPGPRERLAAALRTGPFHDALSAAMDLSGLGLVRVRDRLGAAGAPVSVTTLSYWRSGRTLPSRRESRRVVETLETVLDLPRGALVGLLDGTGARRADLPGRIVGQDRLWGSRSRVLPLLSALAGGQGIPLALLDLRDELEIDSDRRQRRHLSREVVRATTDQVRSKVVTTQGVPGSPPRLTATRHCSIAQVETIPDQGFTIAELVLPRPIDRGETAVLEYEFEHTEDQPDPFFNRLFRYPVHAHMLELHFAPNASPTSCRSYRLPSLTGPERDVTPVPVTPGTPVHVYTDNVPPGIQGVAWEWD